MDGGNAPLTGTTGRRTRLAVIGLLALAVGIAGIAVLLKVAPSSIHGRKAYEPPVDRAGGAGEHRALGTATGQTVYVPVYSHIYHRGGMAFLLEVTLSVRNTDRSAPITVTAVDYHDTQGRRLRKHLDRPLRLPPLATAEFLVEEEDESGGSGANFIVEWVSAAEVSEPVIEAVMIGTAGSQGISFLSPGRVVARTGPADEPPGTSSQQPGRPE